MSRAYRLVYARNARKFLDDLRDASLAQRLFKRLDEIVLNPTGSNCEKLAGSQSEYRARVGDYRILYEISEQTVTITVFRIAHRREVYR